MKITLTDSQLWTIIDALEADRENFEEYASTLEGEEAKLAKRRANACNKLYEKLQKLVAKEHDEV
jgi:hypothetical protein